MKKLLPGLLLLLVCFNLHAQVANDDCVNATPITIPASGTVCVTGSTANALGTIYTSHPCYPANQNIPDVWYTFIVTGSQNVVTVTPTGGTPAQQVGVTLTDFPCTSGSLSTCNMSSTAGGTASANYIYAPGTQVWINVGSVLAQGGFQLCVSSTTPPPGPGGSCATATVLCDKSTFTLNTFPGNVTPLQPSCFGNSFQDPVFYQFTCGQSGTCEWTANPIGNSTELDWVMYDITTTCPNNSTPELACNFFYAGSSGANAGMSSTLTTANCPITNGAGPVTYEYCAPANLVAGNTYLLIIDNYTAIAGQNAGFTLSWGGTFTIAPTSQFTANPLNSCSPPVNVNFNNTSTTAVSYNWSFGNGNTSTSATPPAQTYTASGVYLVSLTATSHTGCTDISTQTITVGTPPTVTVPTNTTVCGGATIPAAVFTSTPAGATFAWTNSNPAIGLAASGNANIPSFTATNTTSAAISGVITVTPTLNGCTGAPQSYTITVNPGPVLTTVTSQTLCANASTAAINYSSTPSGATVNWTNSNGTIGVGTSGVGDILSFTALNSGNAAVSGSFSATPSLAGCTGPPVTFTITVNPVPALTAVPSQTVCAGASTAAITFTTTPTATVNWTNSNNTIGVGSSGAGNIGAFTGTNSATTPAVGSFSATPTLNGCTGAVQTFSITVNPMPSIAAVTSQTVCAGLSTSAINFNPSPAATTVNWTNSQPSIGIGASGAGDIAAFTAVNTSTVTVTGNFVATPTLNGCTGAPQNFSIVVNPGVIVNPITNVTVCNTDPVPASAFTSTPGGAAFGWTNTTTSIGLGSFGAGNYAQFNASNLTTNPVAAVIGVTATLNGCLSPVVNYTITVNPTPPPPAVSPVTYCVNDVASPLTPTGAGITWYTTPALGNPSSSVTPGTAVADTGATNYYVTQTILSCISPPAQLVVTVNPLPVIVAPANVTVCAGAAVAAQNFTSTPAGATIGWQNSVPAIGLAANGIGSVPGFTGANNGSTVLTGVITVMPTLSGCIGSPVSYSVSINPIPTVAVSDVTVCNGSNVTATSWVSVPAGATYSWTNSDPAIGLAASGTGNAPAFIASNSGAAQVNAIVSVTPTLNTCPGSASTYTITVNPTPAAPSTTNVTYCLNDAAVALIATPGAGASLNWYGTSSTGGVANSAAPVPSTAAAGTINYYVSQTVSNCEGPRAPLAVLVNPLPVATLSPPASGCEKFCTDISATSVPAGVSYSWDLGNGLDTGNDTIYNHCYDVAGVYDLAVTVTDINNCTATTPFSAWITVFPKPVADFTASPQPTSVLEPNVNFINLSTGSGLSAYHWDFGDPLHSTSTAENPGFDYSVAGVGAYTVELIAINTDGCRDTIYKPVIIEDDFTLFIPNAFSPNGDGINDFFYPKGIGIDEKHYQLWIFDRWGNMIFYSDEWDKWWDGTVQGKEDEVQEDVYVWKMKVRSFKGDKRNLVGHVTVVR